MIKQSTSNPSQGSVAEVWAIFAEHRNLFMFLGIALIVLGAIAATFPFMTTIAAKNYLGWIFLFSGIVQILHAFSTKNWRGFLLNVLIGVIYVLAGGWLAFFPLTGIITLTMLLAIMFIFQGILEASIAYLLRPLQGWIWVLIAGIISIAAGVMIFAKLPSSAVWAIGLLVGINLISSGWAYLILAFEARKAA